MIRPEQERVKKLLTEAVTLLCRNSLQFEEEVCVEGLIGITLDKRDILLVSIRESIQQTLREVTSSGVRPEKDLPPPQSPGSRKRRRRSRDSDSESSRAPPTPPLKKSAPSPAADHDDDSRPDPEPRLNPVKKERQPDDDYSEQRTSTPERKPDRTDYDSRNDRSDFDTRKIHPANDASIAKISAITPQGTPSQRLKREHSDSHSSASSPHVTPQHPASDNHGGSGDGVRVKQEQEEEGDECFVIDSDSEDMSVMSDMSQHGGQHAQVPLNELENQLQMASQNWGPVDGSGAFAGLGDLSQHSDMSQSWGSQSFDMSGQPMGANNAAGNMSFPGMGGAGPSTSQDGQRRPKCPICHRHYATTTVLKNHVKQVHMGQKQNTCRFCGMSFTQKSNMKVHWRKYHAHLILVCAQCTRPFDNQKDLDEHHQSCYNTTSAGMG